MIDPLEVERRSVFDYRLCDKLISLELGVSILRGSRNQQIIIPDRQYDNNNNTIII